MTGQGKAPTQELLTARRALEGMPGVTLLNDYTWDESHGKWILHCQLSPNLQSEGPIPTTTEWFVLVDEAYPWGSIKFYPAKENGIVQTFPHQSYNAVGSDAIPWRDGDICLDTTTRVLGRHGYDSEPYDIHTRLQWRFQRALDWLEAAHHGELVLDGEPFELPVFPTSGAPVTVAFCEGCDAFPKWQSIAERAGLVDLSVLGDGFLCVRRFLSDSGNVLLSPSWGQALGSPGRESVKGIWLRIDTAPVLSPWQIPVTWGELRESCRAQGIEIDNLLKTVVDSIRDRKRHLALIGFLIPARVGDVACQMHWQAFMLPLLSHGKKTAKGYRPNKTGYWHRDRIEILHDEAPVDWLTSENWHNEQISTRGRLSQAFVSKKVLLIGAGAVGSVIAELLVRAGAETLMVVDGDQLEAGNLVRHTLGLDQLKTPKAAAVANRLNRAVPHTSVSAVCSDFPPTEKADLARIQECDVVVDCTGRDEVLHHLEDFPWHKAKFFFSISLGLQARRLFVFAAYEERFPHARFRDMIRPWLEIELGEHEGEEFPRERIGCWHPVFPARVDDVWMTASIAVKHIESYVVAPLEQAELVVFEQHYEDGLWTGVQRVHLPTQDG